VLTSTLPATLTAQGVITDPDTGLVYLGDGRFYDPALGRPLQPNPAGGPPTVPQALNRYAATPLGQPGVAEGTASLPALGYALSIAKNAAAGALGYGVSETLEPALVSHEKLTYSQVVRLTFKANDAALQKAGLADLFNKASTRSKISSKYTSKGLVRAVGEDYVVADGPDAGRVISLAKIREKGTGSWRIWNTQTSESQLLLTSRELILSKSVWETFLRDSAWGVGIGVAIEAPFFAENVLNDPYLTPRQKGWQAGITFFGIATSVGVTARVGLTFGGIPGAMAGFAVGLGYEYILVPYVIRPLIYKATGVDPYEKTRNLAPLEIH
jgi:hypothetical protein